MKLLIYVELILALVAAIGCQRAATRPTVQAGSSLSSRADQGNTLLNAAAAQLNDLPAFVDTALRTPSVILDSRRSADGQDVVAVATGAPPNVAQGPFNHLIVQAGNARFRSLRVRPDDIVKFYIKEDESIEAERREELRQTGLERLLPIDLIVAQVRDENVLIIQGGLDDPELALKPGKIEIWRYLDDRMVEISDRLKKYAERRLPELGWEPSPDEQALNQIIDRLNQWARQSEPTPGWQLEPLLKSLNPELLKDQQLAARLSAASLAEFKFEPHEGRLLQEAVWLRDISRWAPGDRFDDIGRAEGLFDWTIRNIQLEADEDAAARRPWQVLLHGRGSADQRAWVFALLCRQQGLDAVVLTRNASAESSPSFSLPAVLIGGQLYVFDPRLGLPIRGPDGQGIATLQQLQTNDSLLRQLDLDDAPYPLSAEMLQQPTANIIADAFDLSQAAYQLEQKLSRVNRVILFTNPSKLANQLTAIGGIGDVRLWDVPFKTLRDQLNLRPSARNSEAIAFQPFAWRPKLWLARVHHFHGRRKAASDGRGKAAEEALDDHRKATALYKSPEVRPAPRVVARAAADKRRIDETSQINAAYWLGLLLFDDEKFEVAADWLDREELKSEESPWKTGASYNLGRTWEAMNMFKEAINRYEEDTSPQRHGNRLRAKQLRERLAEPAQK